MVALLRGKVNSAVKGNSNGSDLFLTMEHEAGASYGSLNAARSANALLTGSDMALDRFAEYGVFSQGFLICDHQHQNTMLYGTPR